MISKCTTGCPMVFSLRVVSPVPARYGPDRSDARTALNSSVPAGLSGLHPFARCGRLTVDMGPGRQPEGRSGMMGGLEPEGESKSWRPSRTSWSASGRSGVSRPGGALPGGRSGHQAVPGHRDRAALGEQHARSGPAGGAADPRRVRGQRPLEVGLCTRTLGRRAA